MSFEPEPPRRPRLWDAWTAGQMAVFGLLLLGAGLFWSGLVYSLTGDPFVAAIAETVMAVVLPCAVAAWWHGETLARAFQLRARWLAAMIGVALGAVSWAPAAFLAGLSSRLHPPSPDYLEWVIGIVPQSAGDLALAYLAVVVAAPVSEELVFRGILFRVARDRWGWLGAAVLTGLFFGVAHWQPWNLFGLVGLGFVLALSYHLTRSLLVPILAHATYNAISLTLLVQRVEADGELDAARAMSAMDWVTLAVSTAALAGLLAWLWRRAASPPEAVRLPDDQR